MENFNIEPSKTENLSEIKEKSIYLIDNLHNKNNQFIDEIKEIINSNQELKKGLYEYSDSIEECLAGFNLLKWGKGNFEKVNLAYPDYIQGVKETVNKNTETKPSITVFESGIEEWSKRTNEIKDLLTNFTGDEQQAFDLIQEIHQQKVLKPLNDQDSPLFERVA